MLEKCITELYNKFRLLTYKKLFESLKERDGSLSATEAFAVDALYLLDKPTVTEFAEYLSISLPNATYKLNNLIEKGYIEKVQSDDDRRSSTIAVSKKYLNYYVGSNPLDQEAIERLKGDYTASELKLFEKILNELIILIGQSAEKKGR